ncbi:MAG: aminopeptidase P family N-terminal domain-containing protein, partial [Acidobacteriota bacterium]
MHLISVDLPEFGRPTVEPVIPPDIYEARVEAARSRARQAGYDGLIIFGDREHSANLAYLCGFDPRFEEALLILTPGKTPALLVGNEGWGYADISPIQLRKVLYQSFSLLAQPRDRSRPLVEIFEDEGIGKGGRVGVV